MALGLAHTELTSAALYAFLKLIKSYKIAGYKNRTVYFVDAT